MKPILTVAGYVYAPRSLTTRARLSNGESPRRGAAPPRVCRCRRIRVRTRI